MLNYIILAIFAAIFAALVFLARKATLDQLPLLPDEKTLFTEDNVRVESTFRGGNRIKTIYPRCHIVVTNKRIAITQPIWLRKNKFVLHQVINYTDPSVTLDPSDLMGGFLFKGGYMTLPSNVENMKLTSIDNKTRFEITIPFPNHGPLFNAEPKFTLFTNNKEEYQKHLALRA